MNALIFIGHHWLALLVLIAIVAACIAEPSLALIFVRKNWQALLGVALLWFASVYFEHVGARQQAQRDAKTLSAKNAALNIAAAQLRGAGDALRAQDKANAQRIAAALQAAKDADAAKQDADRAADRMSQQIAGFPARIAKARANPTCAALLSADRMKVCGL